MKIITNREDFVKNDAHKSLFIEAGAGAGKSTTMVDKIVQNILSGVLPEKIVAITFTNKSAEDLLIRVSERINNERKKAEGEKKAILDNVFHSLYKMKISTIHSFCYKILSEYSFDAKIPYGVELIKEDDLDKITTKAFNQWMNSLSSHDWNLLDNIALATDSIRIKDKIKELYDLLCRRMVPDMEVVDAYKFDIEPYYNELHCIYAFINRSISEGFTPCKSLNKLNEEILIPFFEDAYKEYPDPDSATFFDFYKNLKAASKLPNAQKAFLKMKDGSEETVNEKYNELKDAYKEKLGLLDTYYDKDINAFVLSAYQYYLSKKESIYITNNELVYKAYELIKDNLSARKKISEQYDVIYVDEFQDTDKYQIDIIKLLTQEIDKRKKKEDVGSLVVVGDPKQSIYRFRGADFESYMGFKTIFPTLAKEDYEVVCLPDNFRSSSIILDWVNDTYSKMNFYDGYKYEPMLYPDNHKLIDYSNNPKALAGVYLHKLREKDDYSAAAELVDFLVKNKYQIMAVKDRSDKHSPYIWKDIEYRDFLVIFASKTHLDSCSKAFAKRGIPYDITGKLEVSSYEGVRELIRLLNYLLIPSEDNKKTALDILSHHHGSIEEINDALFTLEGATKDMSIYGKMYYLFNNYDQYLNNLTPIETKGVQSSLYQILENIYKQNLMSASELMDAIFDLATTYQDTAISLERENNVVRIMNAHQTKGLEANIVLYISSTKENNAVGHSDIVNGKIYLNSLKQYPDISNMCQKQMLEECLRKEYVIATRARQVMIFDDDLLNTSNNKRMFSFVDYPYDWSNLANYQINEIPVDITTEIDNQETPFIKNKMGVVHITSSPSYIEITPSQLEERRNKEEVEKLPNDVHRPKDNLFGTMLHRCNELFANNLKMNLESIVDISMRENDCDNGYYKKYLLKCLFATRDLFVSKDMVNATLKPEYKFYYLDKKENESDILINGSIDLLMIKDKKITIIDFKSDSADYQNKEQFEKVLKDNYHHQLEAYKAFIEKIYPDYQIDMKIIWYEEINDMVTAQVLEI